MPSDAPTEFRSVPLYFFDQPTRRSRIKRKPLENKSNLQNVSKIVEDEVHERLTSEACGRGTPDTSPAAGAALNIKDHGLMDTYKRAAPQLLNELAGLLSRNKSIISLPHGIINILNYSWQDLTSGLMPLKGPAPTYKQPEIRPCVKVGDEKDAEQSDPHVVGNCERTSQVISNTQVNGCIRSTKASPTAHNTTTSFSISCERSGWIIRPEQLCYDEPPQIALCQWVVERLRAARGPERLQTAEPSQDKPLLRHYGSAQARPKDRNATTKALPAALVNGLPEIPDVKQQNPAAQKLHYRINDGSSFIYYPSGCMAVSQSHSALPCGGFYTNVFSDSQCPAFLATITAFGHGAVTHPLSSSVTALWDQDGGFMCDQLGNITKEWRWKRDHMLRGKIVIQVSDLISVRLFSGTSALLSFKCNNETVHLPLSGLSHINRPKEMTDATFTCSDADHNPLLARKTPAVCPEHRRSLTLTAAFQKVERLQEPSAQWRRGGRGLRELRRLQQRVRATLEDWLAYYREAIGIKCPDVIRMPDALLTTRMKGEGHSAALPSLNPPERTDARPEQGGKELRKLHRHLTAPDTSTKLSRTSRSRGKEGPRVTHMGPLQSHGTIQLESVIIPLGPESQSPTVSRCLAPLPFTPSVPLTVCPVLLRAALLGEGGPKRCCCSPTQMPAVTDLEYDAFVMGQPPHSKQILVVCVTRLSWPVSTQAVAEQNPLEQLYRRTNKHRTMPCTQCQMDSFRLLRYEISAVEHSCQDQNVLLRQRHNAAPGMVLMYIRGKLLFVGYLFSDHKGSVMDLQKQISRARGDYRSGVSLPPDHKYSDAFNSPEGRGDIKLLAAEEKQKASGWHVAKKVHIS